MNWTPIYAALSQVAALCGIPATSITWNTQPTTAQWNQAARMTLSIRNIVSKGLDFEEAVDQAPSNQLVTVVGQRQFNWQVRVDSPNSDPSVIGENYTELLRARLNRSTTNDILFAAGMGIVEIHPTMEVRNVKNERALSSYVMEVVMAAAENDVDTSAAAGNYITTVNITSNKITNIDGTNTPSQVNVTAGP